MAASSLVLIPDHLIALSLAVVLVLIGIAGSFSYSILHVPQDVREDQGL